MANKLCRCYTRRRTLSLCGVFLVICFLSFTAPLLFLADLDLADETEGREKEMGVREGSVKLVRDRGNRNILDVENDIRRAQEASVQHDREEVGGDVEILSPSLETLTNTATSTLQPITPPYDCKGPWSGYPMCEEKMMWMQEFWKTDECYAKNGVNGSLCSFQIYLSEVENFCPLLPGREKKLLQTASLRPQYEVAPLLTTLGLNIKFAWISSRIQRLWPHWSSALRTLEAQQPFTHTSSHVLIHIGALSDKAGFKFAENAGKGGPLGELVQWSDLIASLYALGYKLEFSTEITQVKAILGNSHGGCPTPSDVKFSAIFVDIVGLKQIKKSSGKHFQQYKCLLRVLDTFGTEPVFNFKQWKPERDTRAHDYGRAWGNLELNPRQFMTMYPHTPDNSFLGFVVELHDLKVPPPMPQDSESSLVYGKELYMWEGKQDYMGVIAKYFTVHATIGNATGKNTKVLDWSLVPSFVHNWGILDGEHLTQLLQQSRIFVGLGFPYEGPAPLEAIAQGCVFLNPIVDPPIDRGNSKFFAKKPTNRKIDSQNPYMARFVGEPYVYTIDASNLTEVDLTIQRILKQPRPPPYIPYEFTFAGMLERITAYLKNQQFCRPHQWPPESSLITHISKSDQSCKDKCYEEGLVCEPELFPLLNTQEAMARNGMNCSSVNTAHSVHGPSLLISDSTCSLQQHELLLSCAGSMRDVRRLCPCRKYRKGQVALCLTCSR